MKNDLVLVLNKAWQPISLARMQKAIASVYENKHWQLLQIDYSDTWEYPIIQPIIWEDWIELDIPNYCEDIQTVGGRIRRPTVIITKRYNKITKKRPRPNIKNVYIRDEGICQFSGRKLLMREASIDHIKPLSCGGSNDWTNVVLCDKKINNKKADRTPEQAGLTLLREPYDPGEIPVMNLIKANHRDWKWFIDK